MIAVQVWGSSDRPHFAGQSYIRDGSQTRKASEQQFAMLIAQRSSKVNELTKWVGKLVTAEYILSGIGPRLENRLAVTLESCNEWYVSLKHADPRPRGADQEAIVLDRIQISYDHVNQRLALEIAR